MRHTDHGSDERKRSSPVPVQLHAVHPLRKTPTQNSLDSQGWRESIDISVTSTDPLSGPSPQHCPHGRIIYLDTIIIELLGGARIASKPYSAASGHHIMLLQGDRVWKVTRSKTENRFYLAVADGVAEAEAEAETTAAVGVAPAPAGHSAYDDAAARRCAAVLLQPFVPRSYGIRKVRRLRVGSYELGEEMILSKEDLQRLVAATHALHATSEATESHDGEGSCMGSPTAGSRPSTPIMAVATFSPVSDPAVTLSASDAVHDGEHSRSTTQPNSPSHAPHPPLHPDHALSHQPWQSYPLIAERPQVLQSIVEQFDRDMQEVWLRYYRYVPSDVPATQASPPTGVYRSVGSPLTKAAVEAQPAPPPAAPSSLPAGAEGDDTTEAPCGTPSPTPLAFSFVLSGPAGGPPATEPHLAMEDQLNDKLPASGPPEQSYVEMIVLEDCCHNLQFPCAMDIKMGTRQYGLHASAEKMRSKNKKAKVSTTGQYGIRIDGVRRWNLTTKVCESQDKKYFRRLAIEQVREAVRAFLMPHDASLAQAVRAKVRGQCEALLRVFETQTVYHFYTSSLLFLYDATRPLETCRIVMVDFAYTYQTSELLEAEGEAALPAGGHDESYMVGLRSLISVLADDIDDVTPEASSPSAATQ